MKILKKDIIITLVVKAILLTSLWYVCFKDVKPPSHTTKEWLLSS